MSIIQPLLKLDYKFNTFALLTELDRYKLSIGPYVDKRYGTIDNFKILRGDTSLRVMYHECEKFLDYYGFARTDGEPRYYILKGNTKLPVHTDMDTKCSINHLLEGTAPIHFPDIGDYEYSTALLDISKPHGVDNTNLPDRLLYKISFFNHTFEEVKSKIMNRQ
jgi:hypothetical protein